MSKLETSKSGFTLIELMVTLVLLGLVVTMMIQVFSTPVNKSLRSAAVTELQKSFQALESAITAWEQKNGNTLSSLANCGTFGTDTSTACGASVDLVIPLIAGGFLTSLPTYSEAIFPITADHGKAFYYIPTESVATGDVDVRTLTVFTGPLSDATCSLVNKQGGGDAASFIDASSRMRDNKTKMLCSCVADFSSCSIMYSLRSYPD